MRGYRPVMAVGGCPNCGKQPRKISYDRFSLFAKRARAECECGVCSPWVPIGEDHNKTVDAVLYSWANIWPMKKPSTPPPKPNKS